MRDTFVFTMALLLASACGDAVTNDSVSSQLIMSEYSIGPLSVGMTRSEVQKLGLRLETGYTEWEGDSYDQLIVNIGGKGEIVATLVEDGIFELSTTSPVFVTKNGAHVGSTLRELRKLFPKGRVIKGYADGLYFNFLTGSPGGVFVFDVKAIEERCVVSEEECPESGEFRAIRYFIR